MVTVHLSQNDRNTAETATKMCIRVTAATEANERRENLHINEERQRNGEA